MIQKNIKTILIEYLRNNHNKNRVYHITSDYYKQSIIKNGLTRQIEVTQNQIDSLEILLKNENFSEININLDATMFGTQSTLKRIKESFKNIQAPKYEISASQDYLKIFDYLKEETKGGQYLKEIKKVISGVEQKIYLDNDLLGIINENISDLRNFINKINQSGFLLCIIDKTNIKNTGDEIRFQTTENIKTNNIIEIIEINEFL